ncbi:MAG: glycosyltransferase family 25 protein [Aestuariivita sp.]|nr:glycosyltransferase family 25 protein [Aestuariivita sp.]
MIPCFVISLPDCTARRKAISTRLERLRIDYEFFDAVDGRAGLPCQYENQIDRLRSRKLGRNLCDAEYACALSHINVYRRIVSDAIPYALVLEDDAIPLLGLRTFLTLEEYYGVEVTDLHFRRRVWIRRGSGKKFGCHTSYLVAPGFTNKGTTGYVISQKAAQHFIEHAIPVIKEADWPDCADIIVRKRQFRIVVPPLVQPDANHGSTIDLAGRNGKQIERWFFRIFTMLYWGGNGINFKF